MNSNKRKKIWSIILDVVLVLIVILLLIVCISSLSSRNRGYTTFFGKAVYAVKTDSMKGAGRMVDNDDNPYPCATGFDKYALVFSKVLKTNTEKKDLKIGDVITFWTVIDNQTVLNTHRIIDIIDKGGPNHQYRTKGDNPNATIDTRTVSYADVVAIYSSHISGIGAVVIFAQTQAGFFTMIVLPSILILVYCAVSFILAIKRVRTEMAVAGEGSNAEAEKEALKEQLRRELLQEFDISKDKHEPTTDNSEPKTEPELKTEETGSKDNLATNTANSEPKNDKPVESQNVKSQWKTANKSSSNNGNGTNKNNNGSNKTVSGSNKGKSNSGSKNKKA